MRRLFVFFFIFLSIVVGGDFLLRTWAEARAAAHVQEKLELDQRPAVSFGGWPFLFSALDGRFVDVRIETGPVAAQDIRLDDVHLNFRDVEISLGDALGEGAESVQTGGGRGEAFISASEAERGLGAHGAAIEVALEGGSLFLSGGDLPGRVQADADVRGGRLILLPRGAPQRYEVPLPEPVDGMEYRTASARGELLVLRFNLAPGRLRRPG